MMLMAEHTSRFHGDGCMHGKGSAETAPHRLDISTLRGRTKCFSAPRHCCPRRHKRATHRYDTYRCAALSRRDRAMVVSSLILDGAPYTRQDCIIHCIGTIATQRQHPSNCQTHTCRAPQPCRTFGHNKTTFVHTVCAAGFLHRRRLLATTAGQLLPPQSPLPQGSIHSHLPRLAPTRVSVNPGSNLVCCLSQRHTGSRCRPACVRAGAPMRRCD